MDPLTSTTHAINTHSDLHIHLQLILILSCRHWEGQTKEKSIVRKWRFTYWNILFWNGRKWKMWVEIKPSHVYDVRLLWTIIAAMRSRNFLDAAQAEKMREREAMENVKLLYHDNMIEMTPVSIVQSCVNTEQYVVLLKTFTFVILYNHILQYLHFNKICNTFVVGIQIIILTLSRHESIKYLFLFLVGKAVHDRWCDTIG